VVHLVTIPSKQTSPGTKPGGAVKGPIDTGIPSTGGQLDMSYMNAQLQKARRAETRAKQAYKALMVEHQQATKQLESVDQRINQALMAQAKLQNGESPLKEYSKLQRRTLNTIGLGNVSNKQSLGLAAITIALGLTAIIGRVD
jgi:ferric-dicitrate binding protein FerR (iron transport regulator)